MSMSVTGRRTGISVSKLHCRGQERVFPPFIKLRYMIGHISYPSAADPLPTRSLNSYQPFP